MNTSFNLIKAVGTQNLLDISMPGIAAAVPAVAATAVAPSQPAQRSGVAAPALPLFAQSMGEVANDASAQHHELADNATATQAQAAAQPGDEDGRQANVLPAMSSPLLQPSLAALPAAPAAIPAATAGDTVDADVAVKARAGEKAAASAPAEAAAPAVDAGAQPLVMTASLLSSTFAFRNFGQAGASAPAADTRPALAAAAPLPQAVPQRDALAAVLPVQPGDPSTPALPRPASALPASDATPADTDDASSTPAAPSAVAQQMAAASTFAAPLVATIMPAVKFANPPATAGIGNVDRTMPRGEAATLFTAATGMADAPPVLRAVEAGAVQPLETARAAGAKAAQSVPAASFVLPGDSEGGTPAVPAATLNATSSLAAIMGAGTAPAAAGDTVKLNGPAQQWQEPLREALGERLQTQIGRNSEHAVIRLDPPMLGRIEISIRHQAGALQVNLSASNTEVLRQLQGIGESMRNDLAQRQYTDVAVSINATPRSPAAQAFAEHDGRGQRQPGRQHDDAEPGRALSDGAPAGTTFAMHEREYN